MIISSLPLTVVDSSWSQCLTEALSHMNAQYLQQLFDSSHWLPGKDKIFNAFSLPINQVNYVLFGESPYPRKESANGYAFWDANVKEIWSPNGFSKQVNRATSLRNIFKMLLVAEGVLSSTDTQQAAIAKLEKKNFIQYNNEFFNNLLMKGFLLLNATPVLSTTSKTLEARMWKPFIQYLLSYLLKNRNNVTFILLGNIAAHINQFIPISHVNILSAEHPYNLSFIDNPTIIDFFKPLRLLLKN